MTYTNTIHCISCGCPKINRIVFSRDITWDKVKPKVLIEALGVYDSEESDSCYSDDSIISSEEYKEKTVVVMKKVVHLVVKLGERV